MRPNIDISHTLNGRVKDYAEENNLTVEEAYSRVIKAGLIAVLTAGDEVDEEDIKPDGAGQEDPVLPDEDFDEWLEQERDRLNEEQP